MNNVASCWLSLLIAVLLAVTGAGAAACGERGGGQPVGDRHAGDRRKSRPGRRRLKQRPSRPCRTRKPPVSNDSGGGRPFSVGAVGWRFKPTVDVEVTSLGFYDAEQDGLAAAHRVGIFDAKTDDLVARVVVTPGSPLDGAFRWESLDSPVALKSGHSYLVAAECAKGDALFDPPAGEWAPEIAYDRLYFAADGFAAPHEDNGWLCFGGPNFKFVPASASSSAQARPASKEVLALLEGRMAAMNRGDGVAAAEYYALNGGHGRDGPGP